MRLAAVPEDSAVIVSMKSGLGDRNNPCLQDVRVQAGAVSMKSGLGDRNNQEDGDVVETIMRGNLNEVRSWRSEQYRNTNTM